MKGSKFKIILFADNMMLYVTNPISLLLNLQDVLQNFEKVLGLAINPQSNILAINLSQTERKEIKRQFKY